MKLRSVLEVAEREKQWIIDLRRKLHQKPELKYQEFETSKLVRGTLDSLRIEASSPMATTGLVATVGNGNGPCIALRADMDALPIHETANVEFKSQVPGVMHACGHDCHTAMLLGAAKILKSMEEQIQGTVKFVFQPAEEGGAGGEKMVLEGALENPKVDRIFGLHVWPTLPTGMIGGRSDTILAATGTFKLTVRGLGGHAAYPHATHDPIIAMSHIVCALQTIVARQSDPLDPSVVSVTAIHGGTAFNVIPTEVVAIGTIRSLRTEGLARLRGAMSRIAEGIAAGMQCTAVLEPIEGDPDYPATVNTEQSWRMAKEVAGELLSESAVAELQPVMGGEDFAFYLQKVDGCFIALGTRNEAKGATHFVHTPDFLVDEDALPLGTAMHVGFALRSLQELAGR